MFEKEFVDWIEQRTSATDSKLLRGIGDDACVLGPQSAATVLTTDTLCDGVHFETEKHDLKRIGRKALNVSVSDILAMGATPQFALLTFFMPKSFSLQQAKELFLGAESAARENGVTIVGGDTNRYDGPLIVGSTLTGVVEPERVWNIDGAQAGDEILVTGSLGGSILGHHLDFQPRTQWVKELASEFTIHAATDITDSLSLDLAYLLTKSGVGAELDGDSIPISGATIQLSKQSQKTPLQHALSDGEDFELLLVVEPSVSRELQKRWPDVVTKIGQVTQEKTIWLMMDGERTKLVVDGYEH